MNSELYLVGAVMLMMTVPAGGIGAEPADIVQPNALSCTPVRTAEQLQAIRNNLAGSYCLAKDIDLRSIANFLPIGNRSEPFVGNFFGNHHTISNLKIRYRGDISGTHGVGLFGTVFGGTIQNVNLVKAYISATRSAFVGGLVGRADSVISPVVISNVSVSGQINCLSDCDSIGGMIGILRGGSVLANSSSSVTIFGGLSVGGLVGYISQGGMNDRGVVRDSFATGNVATDDVSCSKNPCYAGGLVGGIEGSVVRSLATGQASSGVLGSAGGLVGASGQGARISLSYATGSASGGRSSHVGGLVGRIFGGSRIDQSLCVPKTRFGNIDDEARREQGVM